jgi:WD40 repeat protein
LIKILNAHSDTVNFLIDIANNMFATASFDSIKIWKITDWKFLFINKKSYNNIKELVWGNKMISDLVYSKGRNILISSDWQRNVAIWSMVDYKCIKSLKADYGVFRSLILPFDYIAFGSHHMILVYDLLTGECVKRLECREGSSLLLMCKDHRIISNSGGKIVIFN